MERCARRERLPRRGSLTRTPQFSQAIYPYNIEQRLDGVLRFGDELVVVIESKTVGHAPSDQAKQIRLREVKVQEQKVIPLGWHELLEDWWTLLERELLAPTERVLMEDLIAFVEEHFAHLLPSPRSGALVSMAFAVSAA